MSELKAARPDQDHEIDIRGEVCPYTFVKSKLALEMIETGQTLSILCDYEPAIENVPRSFEAEGHSVLGISELSEGEWAILIKKNQRD